MDTPKFSILIPTRNGMPYLKSTVESVLSQPSGNFELIVSDNHSTDGTREYLASVRDPRFRSVAPETLLSMTQNFEFVLAQARGEWVTALGDDDGLMPFFFESLDAIGFEKFGLDAVSFRRAFYFWEGCEELYGNNVASFDYSPVITTRSNFVSILLSIASVQEYFTLPQLYTTGLVKRAFIERIKSESGGRFFHDYAPDAASAAALMLAAPKHLRIEAPHFWTGTSVKSTGYSQSSRTLKARSDEFDELNARAGFSESRLLPPSIATVFDISIYFYRAVTSNPLAGSFWKSKPVYYLLLAGLIRKDGKKFAPLVRQLHASAGHAIALQLAAGALWVLRRLDRLRTRRARRSARQFMFQSASRTEFPAMADASAKAQEIWRRARA